MSQTVAMVKGKRSGATKVSRRERQRHTHSHSAGKLLRLQDSSNVKEQYESEKTKEPTLVD